MNGFICSQRSESFQGILSEGSFIHGKGELAAFVSFGESTLSVAADPTVCSAVCWILMGSD